MRKCSKMVFALIAAFAVCMGGFTYASSVKSAFADGETEASETYSLGDIVKWQAEDGFKPHQTEYTSTDLKYSSGSFMDIAADGYNLSPFTKLNGKDGDFDKVASDGNSTWATYWQYQILRPTETPEGDVFTSVVAVVTVNRSAEITLGVADNESIGGWTDWWSGYRVTQKSENADAVVLKDCWHFDADKQDQLKAAINEKFTVSAALGDVFYIELGGAQDRNFQNVNQYKITVKPVADAKISVTESYAEAVRGAISAKSGTLTRNGYEITFLSGNPAKKNLNATNLFGDDYAAYSSKDDVADLNNDTDAYFQPWQYKSGGQDKAAVIKIKPSKNVRIEVKTKATVATNDNGELYDWASTTASKYNYYLELEDGSVKKVFSKAVPAASAENEHGYVAHVKAGESFYFTFASNFGVITQNPDFIISEADYDANWQYETVLADVEKLDGSSMISDVIANGLKDVETDHVIYGFRYGKVGGELKEFGYHAGIGDGDWRDCLLDSEPAADDSRYGNAFWRWQVRCSGLDQSVIRIKAKNNTFVDFTHAANSQLNTTGANFKVMVEDENGILITLKDSPVTLIVEENQYGCGVHLKAGDTMYVVMYRPTEDSNTVTSWFVPLFTVTPSLYNEENRADFDYQIELNSLKEEKKTALDGVVGDMNMSDYSDEQWLNVEDIALTYKQRIEDATTKEAVNELYDEAVASINAVPTKAQEEAALNAVKTEKKAYIESLAAEKDYSSADWKKIVSLKENAISRIETATSVAAVNAAVANYVNALANFKKVEDNCKTSFGGTESIIAVLAAFAVMGIVVIKRKKENR